MTRMKFEQPIGHYIDLQTRDQAFVRSYVVQPEGKPLGALVVLQHMDMRQPGWQGAANRPQALSDSRPGVNPHVRLMCEQFAAEGYLAIAPSTFSRGHSGRDYGYRFEHSRWGPRLLRPLQGLESDEVMIDIETALTHARRLAPYSRLGVVGYCWGGLLAWRAACAFGQIDAAVCYYGGGMDGEADRSRQPLCPVMAHFGSDGRWMARSGVQAFVDSQEAVARANPHAPLPEMQIHQAGYGFMQPQHENYDEATSRAARRRSQGFLERHLSGQAQPTAQVA